MVRNSSSIRSPKIIYHGEHRRTQSFDLLSSVFSVILSRLWLNYSFGLATRHVTLEMTFDH